MDELKIFKEREGGGAELFDGAPERPPDLTVTPKTRGGGDAASDAANADPGLTAAAEYGADGYALEHAAGLGLSPEKDGKSDKKGAGSLYQRFREYRKKKKAERDFLAADARPDAPPPRRVSDFLNFIETQLGGLDEQNKLLLMHVATVKDNNDLLMEEVKVLTKNNELLYRQFMLSKRREKISKIIAIVSSSLAAGLTVYKFLQIFQWLP